jgi:hypothetical protein
VSAGTESTFFLRPAGVYGKGSFVASPQIGGSAASRGAPYASSYSAGATAGE